MIVIAILSILFLVILHELGHFLVAKKFNVKVEEFGIGIPPRIIGKKFGETIYSLNLLPIGAFVRMLGEEERKDDPRSFSKKPVFQRLLIVAGGVVAFWLISFFIFFGLGATSGIPSAVSDEEQVSNPRVQIIGIAKDSPAQRVDLQPGDVILQITDEKGTYDISTVGQIQEFSKESGGKELTFKVQRMTEVFEKKITPRANPPADEGALGITLARTALLQYSVPEAFVQGIRITWQMTVGVVAGLWKTISSLVGGQGLPPGAQFTGPVGIVFLLKNTLAIGIPSFLFFLATLSVYLAVFNVLPIPAADGGRLLLLCVEGIRKKPLSENLEKRIIGISFGILILLLIAVTIKDISKLF